MKSDELTGAEAFDLRRQLLEQVDVWTANEADHLKQADSLHPWILVPSATSLALAYCCFGLSSVAWCLGVFFAVAVQMIALGASMRRGLHLGMAQSARMWLEVMDKVGKEDSDG